MWLTVNLLFQNVQPERFESNPILFGDYMKMGADPSDRLYEELTDVTKVKNLLTDVCVPLLALI